MVKKKGGQLKASYSAALKGFAAKLDKEALHELRTDPDIAYIEPDQYIHAVNDIVIPMDHPSPFRFWVMELWGLDRIDQLDNLPLDQVSTIILGQPDRASVSICPGFGHPYHAHAI